MLLIQTAIDQEVAAVKVAGSCEPGRDSATFRIADRECVLLKTGIGQAAARQRLIATLESLSAPELVISIGLCGGLRAEYQVGQTFLIEQSHSSSQTRKIPANLESLATNLSLHMRVQSLVTIPRPALTALAKRSLAEQFEVGLCDMETYAVAEVCAQRHIPWVGARVVSDHANENIPAWVLTLPRLIEQKQWLRLLGRLATHPQDLPLLIRLGRRMKRLQPILTQLTQDLVTHVLPARP